MISGLWIGVGKDTEVGVEIGAGVGIGDLLIQSLIYPSFL